MRGLDEAVQLVNADGPPVVATVLLRVVRPLPAHRHPLSPKRFTQPQLLACLVLKEFLHLDYRGLAAHLVDHADLLDQVGLKVVPHYTRLQKAAQRLLTSVPGRRMSDAVLEWAVKDRTQKRRVRLAAVDGTGMESRHLSRYPVRMPSRVYAQIQRRRHGRSAAR